MPSLSCSLISSTPQFLAIHDWGYLGVLKELSTVICKYNGSWVGLHCVVSITYLLCYLILSISFVKYWRRHRYGRFHSFAQTVVAKIYFIKLHCLPLSSLGWYRRTWLLLYTYKCKYSNSSVLCVIYFLSKVQKFSCSLFHPFSTTYKCNFQ